MLSGLSVRVITVKVVSVSCTTDCTSIYFSYSMVRKASIRKHDFYTRDFACFGDTWILCS